MRAPAVDVDRISKSFELPHERRNTLREHVVHPFRRTLFEHQQVLDDISFSVERGEFFGIVGPNGSGKSTLLKIVAGIYRADKGSVHVRGGLSPFIELGVGFNPDLSARDNIRVNGVLLGLTRREVDRRFDDIVGFAELERFVDQKLKNFSSGMHARLAYSIAIQAPFEVLLLDEVLAVGDESFQQKCFQTFERLHEKGKTIIFVSHDLGSVRRFCDRALLLYEGRMDTIGAPDEVIEGYLARERGRQPVGQPVA